MKIVHISIILFFLSFVSAKAQLKVCEKYYDRGNTFFSIDNGVPFGLYYEVMVNIANYMGEELHFALEKNEQDCRLASSKSGWKYLKRTKVYSAGGKNWDEVKYKEPFDLTYLEGWSKKGVDNGAVDKWLEDNHETTLIKIHKHKNGGIYYITLSKNSIFFKDKDKFNKLKSVSEHFDNFDKIYSDAKYWNKTEKHTKNVFTPKQKDVLVYINNANKDGFRVCTPFLRGKYKFEQTRKIKKYKYGTKHQYFENVVLIGKNDNEKQYYGSMPEYLLNITNTLGVNLNIVRPEKIEWNYKRQEEICINNLKNGEVDAMMNIRKPNLGGQVSIIDLDDGGWLKNHSKLKKVYFALSKKSKFHGKLNNIKEILNISGKDYKRIFETVYSTRFDHNWENLNIKDLVSVGEVKDQNCTIKTYREDSSQKEYLAFSELVGGFNAGYGGSTSIIKNAANTSMNGKVKKLQDFDIKLNVQPLDCSLSTNCPFLDCKEEKHPICKKHKDKILVGMTTTLQRDNADGRFLGKNFVGNEFYFQYNKCDNTFRYIAPKYLFSNDFDEAFEKFLVWQKVGVDKNVNKMDKEIFTRKGISYFFNWYMTNDKFKQIGKLNIVDRGSESASPIDDNWVNLRDTSMRWIYSDRVKDSMSKLILNKENLFKKLVKPNSSNMNWKDKELSNFMVSNMQMNIDNKCLVNTYSQDQHKELKKLKLFLNKLIGDKNIRSHMGDSIYGMWAEDCDPEVCNNFISCSAKSSMHVCSAVPQVIVGLGSGNNMSNPIYFQYDKCNSKFKYIYPKSLFSDNFDESYVTYLKWNKIAMENNIKIPNISIVKRDNVRYEFSSMNSMLVFLHGNNINNPLRTFINEDWILKRDKSIKWLYSSQVQDFVRTNLSFNQEALFE